MDSVGTIIFSILFVFVIGFIIYFTIDYLKYKEEIKNKMEQNDVKFSNLFTTDNTITSNLDIVDKSLTKKHNDDSSDLNAFDSALKNYFSFGDNNLSIQNEKLFEHVFSRISPNLELLTHVNTAQGLMVNTNKEVLDSRNMKICNDEKSCIYMNVNDDGFNITPDSVNNLTINSTEKTPLAKFDLENNNIYFGGDDHNSPLFIQDDKVFIHNIDMSKALTVIKKEYIKFIVYYMMYVTTFDKDTRYISIHFHVISNYDYLTNDHLTFAVPFLKSEDINKISKVSKNQNIIPVQNITLHSNPNFNVTMKLTNNLPSKTFVKFSLSGINIGGITVATSGILIGERSIESNQISPTHNANVVAPSLPFDATTPDSNTTSINTP